MLKARYWVKAMDTEERLSLHGIASLVKSIIRINIYRDHSERRTFEERTVPSLWRERRM